MNEGYIKFYRKTFDNPIICKDSETFFIWMYLLVNATHKEIPTLFKGEKITLKRGELITGIISISNELSINKNKVQRTLKLFESDKQIEQQTSNKNRLITIVNWDKYQTCDNQDDKQVINKRKTSDKQVITNKNEKNVKNERNNIYAQMFEKFWSIYPKKRQKAKCKEWYLKNKPNEELQKEILLAIAFFKNEEQWKKDGGQFIPYPTTFLNQKRWEDIK